MDNGPEFISATLAEEHNIKLEFIKPGTPIQNSYIERFNRTYRDEILNEVRELTESWIREYNGERSHDSLNDLTPWEYLAVHKQGENSNLGCHEKREVYTVNM